MIFLLYLTIISALVGSALCLSERSDRRLVGVLILAGFLLTSGKIWLFQQTPQWNDINPDSITYDLNARALVMHWAVQDVPIESYHLRGLIGCTEATWTTDDSFKYSYVFRTSDWLYIGYVGVFYWAGASTNLVIYSNAALAALFGAATFGIALALGASRKLALIAATLALLDPNAGVNAATLLKDTLAGALAMAALWAALVYIRKRCIWSMMVLFPALGMLGVTRFVAYTALLLAIAGWMVWRLLRADFKPVLTMAVSVGGAVLLFNGLMMLPQASYRSNFTPIIKAGLKILEADRGTGIQDQTVLSWKENISESTAKAIIKSVAHTFFAPYPWVAISPGMTWKSFTELYYPGVILWIVMLPGILNAFAHFMRHPDPASVVLILFLGAIVAAYTIYFGEFSTRQRVFVSPAYFAMGGIGWSLLLGKFRKMRPAQ